MTNGYTQNGRSVAEVLREFKDETKDFVTTRLQMLRAEVKEKMGAWKVGIPALAIGAAILLVTLLLFTGFLVALIALAFNGQPWGYALSFAIVTVLYGATGAALALYGVRKIKEAGLVPERTMKVLKQDGIWIQSEARTQV